MKHIPIASCRECGTPLDKRGRNVSGLCRKHALALALLPGNKASRIAGVKRHKASLPPEKVHDQCVRASRSRMAWCPPEYRDEYRRLTRSKMLPAAEARTIIEGLIAAHAERYRRTGLLQQTA